MSENKLKVSSSPHIRDKVTSGNIMLMVVIALLPASAFDVIVVPIVAFDVNGHRLGHGMGYYDRYLVHTTACKIGVAFDCQQVAQIDARPHDVAMDLILTPSAVYDFRSPAGTR